MYDYDYDAEDRPCMYPNDSYSKLAYPENITPFNLYGAEQTAGGQAFIEEWNTVACTNFLG